MEAIANKVEDMFRNTLLDFKKSLKSNRDLKYDEGAVGITTLLYCPLKSEFRKKYPDIEALSNAIDDGYIFENTIEPFLEQNFGGCIQKDPNIPYEIDNFKISGHPDFVIEKDNEIIVIEFKAPIFLKHSLSSIPDDELIFDYEDRVHLSETYILQAKIQKKIVEEYYKKPVKHYLFIKSTLQINGKMKKVYVVKPILESISDKETLELINSYRTDKNPRYAWECSYCVYKTEGICEGKEIDEEKRKQELDEETERLLNERKELSMKLNEIESSLKGRINGQIRWNGKYIGWVQTKVRKVDYKEAHKYLGDEIFEYLMLISAKREKFYKKVRETKPDLIKEKTTKYWKL